MAQRIEHIDVAKGITILLVVLYHSNLRNLTPELINLLGLFRLPLFFFMSGLFFKRHEPFFPFIAHKSDALLKPYLVTSLLWIVLSKVQGDTRWAQYLVGMFYGSGGTILCAPLWFLPHLWSVFVFSWLVFRVAQKTKLAPQFIPLVFAIFFATGIATLGFFWLRPLALFGKEVTLPGLPFSLDVLLVSSAYFMTGSLLKDRVIHFRINPFLLTLSIIIFVLIACFSDAHIDLNHRLYIRPVLATCATASGLYFMLSLSLLISKTCTLKNVFLVCGSSSLFILLFHSPIGSYLYLYLSSRTSAAADLAVSILAFLLSVSIPLLIKYIVNMSDVLKLFYTPLKVNPLLLKITGNPTHSE